MSRFGKGREPGLAALLIDDAALSPTSLGVVKTFVRGSMASLLEFCALE